ncbi:MAG: SDR family NAD(P)-dependent oxidoreductase [Halieaceae bacterium]|nr:SDR family NAD(P)-dependent oxidoreductase [Halieaceae bacterium]
MDFDKPIRLDNRVVIVTGAGGGLGRAYAILLAKKGAKVVVNDPGFDLSGSGNDSNIADAVVSEIKDAGGEACASYDSIADSLGGKAVASVALDNYGSIDGLVHNAGILRDKSFNNLIDDDIDEVLAVHLKGAFNVGRSVFSTMKDKGFGRIVFTTSASGLFGNFGQANYGAGKAGLVGLMRVLSIEGEKYGIAVNCISPSARTRMTKGVLGKLSDQLDPDHIAPLVVYLCSDECSFTSEIISAGGGRFARIFIGLTNGWYSGGDICSVETISEKMDLIMETENFLIPKSGLEEIQAMLNAFYGQEE